MTREINTLSAPEGLSHKAVAKAVMLAGLLAITPVVGAFAQDAAETEAPAETTEGATEETIEVGQTYAMDTFSDWEMRCVKTPEDQKDPCTMYQLLSDEGGAAVAEITVFALQEEGDAVAGGSIIAPLETYLPTGVAMQVPGMEGKRYPFTFCNQIGCFARVGFTAAEIAAFKAGVSVPVELRPAGNPENPVSLTVSLSGFTAAYEAVKAYNTTE